MKAEWDKATFAAHDFGMVGAASVVANGGQYASMLPELRRRPELHVGVHLNVFEGTPLSSPGTVPSLLAGDTFFGSVSAFVSQYLMGRVQLEELTSEWRRQIARIQEDGLAPVFLNSHFHLHMLPGAFDCTAQLAREFGIRYVRVTDEPPWMTLRVRPHRLHRALKTAALAGLAIGARQTLRARGLPAPPRARGLGASEQLGVSEWHALLRSRGTAPIEIVCHPAQSAAQREALSSASLLAELRQNTIPFSFRA